MLQNNFKLLLVGASKESNYNNSMKDTLNKLMKLVFKLNATKQQLQTRSDQQVDSSVARHCFTIAFDRFNNGGYCVNLQDHSRA